MEMAASLLVETSASLEDANVTLENLNSRKEVRVGDKLRRIVRKAYFGKKKS